MKVLVSSLFSVFLCIYLMMSAPVQAREALTVDYAPMLEQSWAYYKSHFIVDGNRVADFKTGEVTARAQANALLMAVFMEDRNAYNALWRWSETNLKDPKSPRFGSRWGKIPPDANNKKRSKNAPENGWGLINPESDADAEQDILYAYVLASEKWPLPESAPKSEVKAKEKFLLAWFNSFWERNVEGVAGNFYLAPGSAKEHRKGDSLSLNPGAAAPYAYRKFYSADEGWASRWMMLEDKAYQMLDKCIALTTSELPPNACAANFQTGYIGYDREKGADGRNFGKPAAQLYWRMGLDVLDGSRNGMDFFLRHPYLMTYWDEHHEMPEGFTPEGKAIGTATHDPLMLVSLLSQMHVIMPSQDKTNYQRLMGEAWHPDAGYWFNLTDDEETLAALWLNLYAVSRK